MQKTKIGWCDYSSNPIYAMRTNPGQFAGGRGWFCTKVSPGCANCYSEAINMRFGNKLPYRKRFEGSAIFKLAELEIQSILRHRKPGKVFLCDMLDIFHEGMPLELIYSVFNVVACKQTHIFQILTKRPERMFNFCSRIDFLTVDDLPHLVHCEHPYGVSYNISRPYPQPRPIPNLWLGVSIENQECHDLRVPVLKSTPAALRFLSCEPLLGPIKLDLTGIDWVIVGGESGPGFRPMEIRWLDDIVEQCEKASVPVYVKQDSNFRPGMQGRIDNNTWGGCKMFPAQAAGEK